MDEKLNFLLCVLKFKGWVRITSNLNFESLIAALTWGETSEAVATLHTFKKILGVKIGALRGKVGNDLNLF